VNDAQDTVLWICIEDYAGLWEIVWDLRGHGRGTMSEETLVDLARRTTIDLLDRGWLAAFTCLEPYGDLSPLGADQARTSLADAEAWVLPNDGAVGIRMSVTPAGEAAYMSKEL
jgi:hypothetical protein